MPTRSFLAKIRFALKKRAFRSQYYGGCHLVSRWLEIHYGFRQIPGCFIGSYGEHISHCWNVLPDGRILDATADQFRSYRYGGKIGVFIGRAPKEYIEGCNCGSTWDDSSKVLRRRSQRMRTPRHPASVLLT